MSKSYVRADLRRRVHDRAQGLCEYCLLHEEDAYVGFQIDHIISEKHGGTTALDNLAWACLFCNVNKGSDVGALIPDTRHLVRFYDPRRDALYHQMYGPTTFCGTLQQG